MLEFVTGLYEFPEGKEKISYSCGVKDGYAFFRMDFYRIGRSGICGVLVTMEESVSTEYRKEEKHKLSLELIIESHSIPIFCRELKNLAVNQNGSAVLMGIK